MNCVERANLGRRSSNAIDITCKLHRIGLYAMKQKTRIRKKHPEDQKYWTETFKIVSETAERISKIGCCALVGYVSGRVPHSPLFDKKDPFDHLEKYKTR